MAHHNCNHSDLSGYNVVEVVSGFCEVGEGCDGLKAGCLFAWDEKNRKATRNANKAYADFCQRLEGRLISCWRLHAKKLLG